MKILIAIVVCLSAAVPYWLIVSSTRRKGWRRMWGGRSVKGPDGVAVSMDCRGLVRLEWPREHKYITVGLSLAADGDEPHDGRGGPPPVPCALVPHIDELHVTYTRDGNGIRVERVPEGQRETYVKTILEGLEALGYTVTQKR